MNIMNRILITILAVFTLAACAQIDNGSGDQPVSSEDTPVPSPQIDLDKYEIGERAIVETAEVLILESFPLQVNIKISGNLSDGCTSVYQLVTENKRDSFQIKIMTLREKNAMCAQALVPFEVYAPLDVNGLPAGTYQVIIDDLITEFTFTQDNINQDAGGSN